MASLLVNAFVFICLGLVGIFLFLNALDEFERWFERRVVQSVAWALLRAHSQRAQEVGEYLGVMSHEVAFLAVIFLAVGIAFVVT